jgi:potassium-transporting ATPase KdpC subunit
MTSTSAQTAATAQSYKPASLGALTGQALGMLAVLTLLTGAVYPLLVTGIAKTAFTEQANGSLLVRQGKVIGSRWIGQPFEDPKYFFSRRSSTSPSPYNGGASSGSNMGPTNEAISKAAQERIDQLRALDPGNAVLIPVDLATTSASGLDPHITPAAARYQAGRVARARGLPIERVQTLIDAHTEGRSLGILGEPRVNVLLLNLALDEVK